MVRKKLKMSLLAISVKQKHLIIHLRMRSLSLYWDGAMKKHFRTSNTTKTWSQE